MQLLNRLATNWALVAILLLGGVLRFAGIGFGLPYTYAADEPTRWMVALRMVQTGDLDPHWLGYPHLAFYLNAIALLLYFAAGRLTGAFQTSADIPAPETVTIGVGKLALPETFLLARGLTALFGTGTLLLAYLIGYQVSKRKTVGLLSALGLAVSPAAVANSQMISLDTFGLFFLLLAVYWIILLMEDPQPYRYVLGGIGVGLAISGKYNAGVVAASLLLAHLSNFGWRGLFRREIYLAGAAALLAFSIANPYSVLDPSGFVHGLSMASDSQSQYGGYGGNGLLWYLSYLWSVEGIAIVLALVQAVRLVRQNLKLAVVFLSFPLIYLMLISQFPVRNDRTVLLVIPFLGVLAAWSLVGLFERISANDGWKRTAYVLGLAGVTLLVVPPLRTSITRDLLLTQRDGRETARVWIDASLPAGSRIAQEGYSPYIDTARFVVQGVTGIIDHSPDWYVQDGFEYLVLSQGMYGRFFGEPEAYRTWVDKYKQFFERFQLVKRFDDNGYEIRIYETGARIPTHRIAGRFGNYGELIELVGYEEGPAKWMEGEPFLVTLYWRTLREKPEPLELDLRLVGNGGREIGHAHGDLFQGRGWPSGVLATEWRIPVSANAGPGLFTLDLAVIQSRFAYPLPAKTSNGKSLESPRLGPFKSSPLPIRAEQLQAARAADVEWSDKITLLGYSLWRKEVRAGEVFPLTFFWKSLSTQPGDYTLFVHLLNRNGEIVAQIDTTPKQGQYPTSIWQAGEAFRDDYKLVLPPTIAPGPYTLEIGWYEPSTLSRLPINSPAGEITMDRWQVPEPVEIVP